MAHQYNMTEWYLNASFQEIMDRGCHDHQLCDNFDFWNKLAHDHFNCSLDSIKSTNPVHAYAMLSTILKDKHSFIKALYYQQYAFTEYLPDPYIPPFMHVNTLFEILDQDYGMVVKRILKMYQAQNTDISDMLYKLYARALQEKRFDIMSQLSDAFDLNYTGFFLQLYTNSNLNLELLINDAFNHQCNVLNNMLQLRLNGFEFAFTLQLKQLLCKYYLALNYGLLKQVSQQYNVWPELI